MDHRKGLISIGAVTLLGLSGLFGIFRDAAAAGICTIGDVISATGCPARPKFLVCQTCSLTTGACDVSNSTPSACGLNASSPVCVIPVVWHVLMDNSGTGNVSDASIAQNLAVLNQAYRATGYSLLPRNWTM